MGHAAAGVFMSVMAVFALFTAVFSLGRPQVFGGLLGLSPVGQSGTNEIRAQYGGFFLATAIVCGLALDGIVPFRAGLLLMTTVFGGLIAGRLVSLAAGERFSEYLPTVRLLFFVDAVLFVLSLTALMHERA